jgi:hypothetical protein
MEADSQSEVTTSQTLKQRNYGNHCRFQRLRSFWSPQRSERLGRIQVLLPFDWIIQQYYYRLSFLGADQKERRLWEQELDAYLV